MGEALNTEQLLSLYHDDGLGMFCHALKTDEFAAFHAPKVLEMIPVLIQRLTDELAEPGLGDALLSNFDKLNSFVEEKRKENPSYLPVDLSESEEGPDSEEKEEQP
ncbi:hypothetical protein MD484_g961, partial [Candolleomyces efflorescens]